MARRSRSHLLIAAAAALAAAVPVQVQFGVRSGAGLRLAPTAALAETGDGGGKGGDNGNGNGGGNGNSGNAGGHSGNNGNGNGNGAAGGGNGNSGNGGGKGGNGNGNGGGHGNSGNANGASGAGNGNSGNGNSGSGNSGNGNSGNGNAAGGGSGRNGGGSSGGGASAATDAGQSGGGAGKGSGAVREPNSWSNYRASSDRPGAGRNARSASANPHAAAGRQSRAAAVHGAARAGKSSLGEDSKESAATLNALGGPGPNRDAGAGQPGGKAAGATAAASFAKDQAGPAGSPARPREASNAIVASGLSDLDLDRLAASGLQVMSQTKGLVGPRIVRLRLPKGMSATEARRAVRKVNLGASADGDAYYYTDGGSPECADPGCEAAVRVGWTPQEAAECGPPPLIGLVDTGIDRDHEALRGQSIDVLNIAKEPGSKSSLEHGTAIAALLVGRPGSVAPGLLPGARLVAVDAFSRESGTADRADVVSLVDALEALAERGVEVVNLSLSGPPNEVLRKAVEAAQAKSMVLVAAVGNNGAGAEPAYPAAYPGVIAVTAVDRQFNVYRRATRGSYVAFAAPGVDVMTARSDGGSAARSGTSYAVPFVSAAMAMMRATHPESAVAELEARLQRNARDLGAPGRDTTYGYGLLQMAGLCSGPDEAPSIPVAHRTPPAEPLQQETEAP